MIDPREHRLQNIEAKLDALTQLLLSHIAASDVVTPGVAKCTIDYAEGQKRAAEDQRDFPVSFHLNKYLDVLREALDLPVND